MFSLYASTPSIRLRRPPGLLFGFDTTVINGALRSLRSHFALSELQVKFAANSLLYGCFWSFVPESRRWLLQKERFSEAEAALERIGSQRAGDPTGRGNVRRAIDLHEGDTVDEAALKDLIRAAVALNLNLKEQTEVPTNEQQAGQLSISTCCRCDALGEQAEAWNQRISRYLETTYS